jgi:hypothetical protein
MAGIITAAPVPVDREMKAGIIDSVLAKINEVYIFPEIAAQIDRHFKSGLADGRYDEFTELQPFVEHLNSDLYDLSRDRHLKIFLLPPEECAGFESNEEAKEYYDHKYTAEYSDYKGFKRVEVLDGNVGYLDLRDFIDHNYVYDRLIGAMALLSDCDAIIIDLRRNGGGSGNTVALLASYFFEERARLNDCYNGLTDSIEQYWTFPVPNAGEFPGKPLYVLIGNGTFSAAEDFAYAMQARKRALLIGGKTRGGGHPIEWYFFIRLFVSVDVPCARSINPITGTNWERVGVIPDVEATFEETLEAAYMIALDSLDKLSDDEEQRSKIEWARTGWNLRKNPVSLNEHQLIKFVGRYGQREIEFADGHLYYIRTDKSKFRLVPLTEKLFGFVDWDSIRIEFTADESGESYDMSILGESGSKSTYKKTNP